MMELRAEQAKLLVGVGVGRAVAVIESLMARVSKLVARYADDGRFSQAKLHSIWGEAFRHTMDELREHEGRACELIEIAEMLDRVAERREAQQPWFEELQIELDRMVAGSELPADRDPIRLRAGLVLACQRIARLKLVANRDETGEDFGPEHVRLGGADEMRAIMTRVDNGERPVE